MMKTLAPTTCLAIDSILVNKCSLCGATKTPLWRRGPHGEALCNACGLKHMHRPAKAKKNDVGSQQAGSFTVFNKLMMCANCRTTTTPLWRRDEAGNTICNACGLYYKLHQVHRPVGMKRSGVIKRRKRIMIAQEEQGQEKFDRMPEIEDFIIKKSDCLLPPISSERQSCYKLDSILKRGYELADFDKALDKLENLRRQAGPEQANALSQLTYALTELVTKAEVVLSKR